MSRRRKRKEKGLSADNIVKSYLHAYVISHHDGDHQQASSGEFTEGFYEGSFRQTTQVGKHDGGIDAVFVDESGVHIMQLKATLPTKLPRKVWTGLPPKIRRNFILPTAAEFVLLLMSKARRNDVLNDIMDWYPDWVAEKGRFGAHLACWWRIGVALFGGLLDLLLRIGEIVGKFRGAK